MAHPPAPVPGPAALKDLGDDELLTRCSGQAPRSPARVAACEVLVRRYAPLAWGAFGPYRDTPEPTEDLIWVDYVGLLKAIGNYDPSFGRGLRAYAAPCITGEIKRRFRDKRWQVRVTRTVRDLMLAVRRATESLTHELGRTPGDADLAARLGVTAEEVREPREAAGAFTALSLNAPAGGEDPAELGDLLGEQDNAVEQAVGMEAVATHWAELPSREQRILLLRFYGNLTQEEIAGQLGIP